MRAIFAGSGAAEGVPSLWCRCRRCEAVRQSGGRSVRQQTALWIEPCILVDLPPAIDVQLRAVGEDLSRVACLVITHSHADHLYLPHLRRRAGPVPAEAGAGVQGRAEDDGARRRSAAPRMGPLPVLDVVASPAVIGRIREALGDDAERVLALRLRPALPGEAVEFGAFRFTPVPAHHRVDGDTPYNYVIEGPAEPGRRRASDPDRDGRACIFYGCDTGPPREEAWAVLRRFRFDAVILDATGGDAEPQAFPYHLTLQGVQDVVQRMRDEGLLRAATRVVLAHIDAHHWPLHDEARARVELLGWELAYDGMCLEV